MQKPRESHKLTSDNKIIKCIDEPFNMMSCHACLSIVAKKKQNKITSKSLKERNYLNSRLRVELKKRSSIDSI